MASTLSSVMCVYFIKYFMLFLLCRNPANQPTNTTIIRRRQCRAAVLCIILLVIWGVVAPPRCLATRTTLHTFCYNNVAGKFYGFSAEMAMGRHKTHNRQRYPFWLGKIVIECIYATIHTAIIVGISIIIIGNPV